VWRHQIRAYNCGIQQFILVYLTISDFPSSLCIPWISGPSSNVRYSISAVVDFRIASVRYATSCSGRVFEILLLTRVSFPSSLCSSLRIAMLLYITIEAMLLVLNAPLRPSYDSIPSSPRLPAKPISPPPHIRIFRPSFIPHIPLKPVMCENCFESVIPGLFIPIPGNRHVSAFLSPPAEMVGIDVFQYTLWIGLFTRIGIGLSILNGLL
jgi:hypothetical protein